MEKKKRYYTKDIYLGYITTVNPDSYTVEGQIVKSVLALKRQPYPKKKTVLLPIDVYFPYYSIDEVVPIQTKMKKKSTLITNREIDLIVEHEKYLQRNAQSQPVVPSSFVAPQVEPIHEELEIYKAKKLAV